MSNRPLPRISEARRSRAGLLIAGLVILMIAGFSLIPLKLKRELGFDRTRHLHLASHFVAFATLAFVLRCALRRSSLWWALGITIAVGAILEILEHLAYGAPLEKRDIALDIAAGCGGVLLAKVLVRSSSR
jgi:hypothetical protein